MSEPFNRQQNGPWGVFAYSPAPANEQRTTTAAPFAHRGQVYHLEALRRATYYDLGVEYPGTIGAAPFPYRGQVHEFEALRRATYDDLGVEYPGTVSSGPCPYRGPAHRLEALRRAAYDDLGVVYPVYSHINGFVNGVCTQVQGPVSANIDINITPDGDCATIDENTGLNIRLDIQLNIGPNDNPYGGIDFDCKVDADIGCNVGSPFGATDGPSSGVTRTTGDQTPRSESSSSSPRILTPASTPPTSPRTGPALPFTAATTLSGSTGLKAKEGDQYPCNHCGKSFKFESNLVHHLWIEHHSAYTPSASLTSSVKGPVPLFAFLPSSALSTAATSSACGRLGLAKTRAAEAVEARFPPHAAADITAVHTSMPSTPLPDPGQQHQARAQPQQQA